MSLDYLTGSKNEPLVGVIHELPLLNSWKCLLGESTVYRHEHNPQNKTVALTTISNHYKFLS